MVPDSKRPCQQRLASANGKRLFALSQPLFLHGFSDPPLNDVSGVAQLQVCSNTLSIVARTAPDPFPSEQDSEASPQQRKATG
jgi:hypothetical protein